MRTTAENLTLTLALTLALTLTLAITLTVPLTLTPNPNPHPNQVRRYYHCLACGADEGFDLTLTLNKPES